MSGMENYKYEPVAKESNLAGGIRRGAHAEMSDAMGA